LDNPLYMGPMEYLEFFPLSIKKLSMAVEELSVILVGK